MAAAEQPVRFRIGRGARVFLELADRLVHPPILEEETSQELAGRGGAAELEQLLAIATREPFEMGGGGLPDPRTFREADRQFADARASGTIARRSNRADTSPRPRRRPRFSFT